MNKQTARWISLFLLSLLAMAPSSHALVYNSVYNTTEPTAADITNWDTGWGTTSTSTSVNGWDYVGTINSASAVYLGNGYAIAAGHEGVSVGSTFTLGGVNYTVTAATTIGTADLVVFQISGTPDLPSLTISTASPTVNSTSVVMIGYGGGSETWGQNIVTSKNNTITLSGYSTTDFGTAYGTTGSITNNAYAVVGDSGGAAFSYNSTTGKWVLMGMMEAVDTNNDTYFVQLSSYASLINAAMTAIPEPRTVLLVSLSCLFLAASWMKRRKISKKSPI